MKRILLILTILSLIFPSLVLAHPGRTDSSGCHTCRTNCAKWGLSDGEYHCHRAKALPQPKEPVKSHFSETGGVTVFAPEYKQPATTQRPKAKLETKPKIEKVQVVPVVEKVESKTLVENKNDENLIVKLFKFLFR
jgi:hypothetical protein